MKKKKYSLVYPVIFLLTIFDIAFTAAGLKLGIITEANPIISYFFSYSIGLTSFCVLAYVGAALLLVYRVSAGIPWLNPAMAGLAAIKLYALILHMSWLNAYLTGGI